MAALSQLHPGLEDSATDSPPLCSFLAPNGLKNPSAFKVLALGHGQYEEDITVLFIYTSSSGISNFIRETLLNVKPQMKPNTLTVGNVTTPIDRQFA